MKSKNNIILLFCIIFASIVIFRASWNTSYIGYFADDASYILLAKALLNKEGYVSLGFPGKPPQRLYLPGFPTLLTPFVAILGEHSEQLKWVNTILTALTIGICYLLFAKKLQKPPLLSLIILLPLNLLMIIYASTVMSDPFFCFLSFLILLMLDNYANNSHPNLRKAIFIGLLVMVSASVRVVGLLLLIPIFFIGLKRKDFKLIVAGVLPATALLAFASIYDWLNFYATQVSSTPFNMSFNILFTNSFYYLKQILALITNSPWGFIHYKWVTWFNWLLILPICIGFIKHWKLHGGTWGSYCLTYFLTVAFFRLQDIRLLLPILPFAYFFLFYGLVVLFNKNWKPIIIGTYSVIVIMMLYNMVLFHRQILLTSNHLNTPRTASYEWIKSNSKPSDIFMTPLPPQLFYFTGRQEIPLWQTNKPIQFLQYIYDQSIAYLYLFSWTPSNDPERGDISNTKFYLRIAQEDPYHFQLVFKNDKEKAFIYQINPRKEELELAIQAINNGIYSWLKRDFKTAKQELEKALTIEPDFYYALNSFGIILADNGDIEAAMKILKRCTSLYPSYPQCHAALAYAYKKGGNRPKALVSLTKALQLAKEMDLYPLTVQLQNELDKLRTGKMDN